MGRYRSRSRSLSPRRSRSPPRRKRYDDPRDRVRDTNRSHRGGRTAGPSGLLVRNISLDAKPDDLRIPFERYGPVKDVYLPKNYYTGEPRGFGFVKFHNPDDAVEAKEQMNHQLIGGREIKIVYAEENRKTPVEMRTTSRGDRHGGHRRRSPPRSPRRRYRSYSRSPSPARRDSREVRGGRDDYYSPRRSVSRSPSPRRSISRSLSLRKPISHSPSRRKPISRSPSPRKPTSRSPSLRKPISRSLSPRKEIQRSPSPLPRRPISRSPPRGKHHTVEGRLRSPRQNGRSISRSRSYSPR